MSDSSEEIPTKRSRKDSKSNKKKKKQKFDKRYFLDDIAESGDDEESERDSEFEGEYEEALKLRQELPQRKLLHENLTAEEIAEKYEKKVAYEKANYISKEISVVSKQKELPSINDPKLWQVFCKPGKPKELVINLLAKCINQENFSIFSAFASNVVNDCIYIEAYNKLDVLMAIKGMHNINEHKIIVVPISEMVDVFVMDFHSKYKAVVGEFVRIRSGKYKDDLAQIVSIEDHLGKATVRLVPRLETTSNKKIRPPAKAFNPLDYPSYDKKRDPNTQEVYYSYQGNQFHNGFLYKTLAYRSLNFTDIRPTLMEIKIFDDSKLSMILKPKQINFTQGDKVKVISGDSKGLTGTVEGTNQTMVSIYPFIEELCDQKFDFPLQELCKFFDIGDHVKVIEGRYVGITGMVVSVKEASVEIIADVNKSIINVLANDLKLSEEISAGHDKTENYNINEIVLLKKEMNFGIVTSVNSGGVIVWYHEILKKYSPYKLTAVDRDQNKLCYNDMVKIVFSKHHYSGKLGSLKNALRGTLFVQIQDVLEKVIISVKSSFCLIQGQNPIQTPSLRQDFMNMIVRLKSGPYRGSTGKVIEVCDSKFKVELMTISKIIVVDISACEKVADSGDVMALQDHKKTPAVNSPAAFTPHEFSSPWEVKETPTYSKKY